MANPIARILTRTLSSFEDEVGSDALIEMLNAYISSIGPPLTPPLHVSNETDPHPITTFSLPSPIDDQPAPSVSLSSPIDHTPAPSEKTCPVCNDPVPAPRGFTAGGDGSHRRCLSQHGYENWHTAVYGPSHSNESDADSTNETTETAPSSPAQNPVSEASTPPRMNLTAEVPGAPKKVKIERSGILEKPKKAPKPMKTCEARVLGEKSVIPNTKHTLVYKSAQCSILTTHSVKLDDDESIMPICSECLKNYLNRNESPKDWHGFFDDGSIPDTSHIVGGSWHTKKLANVAKKSANKNTQSDTDSI